MDMYLFLIIMFSSLFLFIIAGTIIFWRLFNRGKTRWIIVNKDKSITVKKTKRGVTKLEFNGSTYLYDDACAVRTLFHKRIYFYQGNPNPIKFDSKNSTPQTTSQDLNVLLNSNLLEQLFREDKLIKNLMLMVGIGIALNIVLIIIVIYTSGSPNVPVELSQSANNTIIIKNAVVDALRGV